MRAPFILSFAAIALIASNQRIAAQTTFTVNATTDTGTGSGTSGDLRYCINQANALSLSGGSATIDFSLPANSLIVAGSIYLLNPGRNGTLGANTNSLFIDGSTATNLTITGNSNGYGIFTAYSGKITIQDLTLSAGVAVGGSGTVGGSGGAGGMGAGGAMLVNNFANVTMNTVTFKNCGAAGGAGGNNSFTGGGGGGGTNGGNGSINGGGGGLGGSGNYGGGGIGSGATGGANSFTPTAGGLGAFTNGAPGGNGYGVPTPGGANGGGGGGAITNYGPGGGGVGGENGGSNSGGIGGFGGGGAAGVGASGSDNSGQGGDFGGGGSGAKGGYGGGGGFGNVGGFGGGGGGGIEGNTLGLGVALGGFGGGTGYGGLETGSGGGMGAGGAVFVRSGGSLNLIDPIFTGTFSARGGAGGGPNGGAGMGIGQGIFLGGTVTINLSAGDTQTYTGDFLGGRGTQPASADPTNDAIGNLIKTGAGTLILGNNSNAGTITVNAGTLQLVNTTPTASTSGLVTINVGTLSGGNGGGSTHPFADSTQGFLNGAVTLNSGGVLSPGSAGTAGLLTIAGGVTLGSGADFAVYLATHNARPGAMPTDVNTNSRVVTPLDILFNGPVTMPIDGGGQSFVGGSTYDFFIGQDSGNAASLPPGVTFEPTDFASPVNASEFSLSRSADGLDVILTFTPTAVPEPGSLALVGLAAAAGWYWRRRK